MLMALNICYKIGWASITSIIGVTNGNLLYWAVTSYMSSEHHLFYQPLTNNKYVTVGVVT